MRSTQAGVLVYSGLAIILAGLGAAVAGRQVWLQHLPKDRVPACGPGLEYMLNKFPLGEVLSKVFMGSGECAEVGWRFLGLSVAGWSLVWFVLLCLLAIAIAAFRRPAGVRK
jgi:disulfide bond formation protein DsbB